MAASSAASGAASPYAPDGGAADGGTAALERLLHDLRRQASSDPVTATRSALAATATALGADAVVVWLAAADGPLAAAVRHPIAGATGTAPSLDALREAPTAARRDGDHTALDSGLWTRGTLAGALTVRRAGDAAWRDAERAFVIALADRLAVDAVRASLDADESYRAIFDVSQDAIFVHDIETGAILDANRRACEVTGVPLDVLRANGVALIGSGPPPYSADDAVAYVRRAAAGEPQCFEWLMRHPLTGADMWVEVSLQRVSIRGTDRILALVRDIGDRKQVELALQASEEAYRQMFVNASDAMWLHDVDTGAFLEVNNAVVEMYGFTVAEQKALGMPGISVGTPPHTPEQGFEHLRRAAAGEPQRFEWPIRHKDGRTMWTEVRLRRVRIGGVDRILATGRDIDDRKRAEEALRESEESYRTIFQHASDAMWLHDIDTNAFLEVNQAAVELLGYTADEQKALGVEGTSDGRAPYTMERGRAYMERALAGEPQQFEWLSRHRDGRPVWEEVTLRRVHIRGEDRVLATGRNISDRKVAEAALRASEESYRTIFQHASDAMWLHDIDTGAFLEVNQAAVEMYGYSAEEQKQIGVPGLSDGRPPFTSARGMELFHRAAGGEPQRFEWLGRHKDGRPVWGEVRLRRVTMGGVVRVLATARDINDRKAVEEELRRTNEVLEQRVDERTAQLASSYAALAEEVAEHARAKEALLQRTRELEGIFQALPDLYFRLDAELRIVDYRAPSSDALYVPPEKFLGKRLRDVMPAPLCDLFEATLAAAKPGELATAEYQLPTGEGLHDFEARFFPLGDGTRITVVRDITERKIVERALHEREAQLRETQRMARLGSWAWDVATNEMTWDPVLCELYGITPDNAPRDFLGYLALVHPEDRGLARDVTEQAMQTHQPFAFDHRVLLPDCSVRYLHGRGSVVLNAEGTPVRMVGSAQDVSERKEAERALREREEHFRRLIENTSDIVTFLEADGTVRYQSPALERLLGYPTGSLDGTSAFDLMHPDDIAATAASFAQLVATPGVPRNATYRYRHIDGSWRVLESTGRTLRDDTAAEGVVIHTRDVTERKMAEEALARAKEDAERANRAKSEFLSRMSHELRTPMNSILGFAQLLARAELPPQQVKSVQHILKAGRHLLHLINEVLEIARIEAGRENFSLEPVSLTSVLQEAFGLVRPLAQQWEVELREGHWSRDAYVMADRQRLVQVLLNLLSNAIKYNRRGGYVRLTSERGDDGRWTVRVEDGGRGIRPDRVEQLFTPFARLGAEQTEVEGTGLGLALSRRLCEAMSGSLELERTGEDGSVFRVELDGAEDPLRTLEETGTFEIPAGPHRTATLLYVEDNLANLSLVDTILLSRPGWRTLPALQGQLGVELAREHLPDVVLLDLHLPDMSGEEVLRRLRGDARTARIPVVVVSADATTSSLERLRAAGADAYLTKPLDVDQFLRVVESFLPSGSGSGSGDREATR